MAEGQGWHRDRKGHKDAYLKGQAGKAMNQPMNRKTRPTEQQDRIGLQSGITPLEVDVLLNGFGKNDFFEQGVNSIIWADMIGESTEIVKGKQVSGVISSLVKKGIMKTEGEGKNSCVLLTEKGKALFQKLIEPEAKVRAMKNAVVQQHIEEYFDCPHCQYLLSTDQNLEDDLYVGKVIECPECKNKVKITGILAG